MAGGLDGLRDGLEGAERRGCLAPARRHSLQGCHHLNNICFQGVVLKKGWLAIVVVFPKSVWFLGHICTLKFIYKARRNKMTIYVYIYVYIFV